MKNLEPIYTNECGAAYSISNCNKNIQIQIGDFAIMMTDKEMPNFLKVIQSAKQGNCCKNCKKTKLIKCETKFATINIKTTPKLIEDIEELVLAIICNYQVETLLKKNNII